MSFPRKNALQLVAALALLAGTSGCAYRTGATEVGVKFNKVTHSMEQTRPGTTYFFLPILNDWKKYDISLQNLVMTADNSSGNQQSKDDLRFKTRDGNDIETDVTVRWRINPDKVDYLWRYVAPSTEEVRLRLVRPQARAYVRDVLNRLDSEEYYNPRMRFAAANDATSLLARHLEPYGVLVEQVLIGDFSFKPEYQRLINSRKEAEKQAEKLEAEILATQEGNQANLQAKVAELTQHLTQAQGRLEKERRDADAYLGRRQQEAQAILAEKSAVSEGIRKERDALNGSAGDAYVDLQIIEALQKKEIRQIPRLPGGSNVIVDGNRLLEQLGVIRYDQARQAAESGTPTPP